MVEMNLYNSFDAKVLLKDSGCSSHWKSYSQEVKCRDIQRERKICDFGGEKRGHTERTDRFFWIWRNITHLACQLGALSSLAQAQGSPKWFHYLLSSKGRRRLLSYFMIIGWRYVGGSTIHFQVWWIIYQLRGQAENDGPHTFDMNVLFIILFIHLKLWLLLTKRLITWMGRFASLTIPSTGKLANFMLGK